MLCAKCGYLLDALDVDCPRCARLSKGAPREGEARIEIELAPEASAPAVSQSSAASSPVARKATAEPRAVPAAVGATPVGKNCPFCQTAIKPGAPLVICASCGMPHHADCWQQNGGCTTFGCAGNTSSGPSPVATPAQPLVAGNAPSRGSANTYQKAFYVVLIIVLLLLAAFVGAHYLHPTTRLVTQPLPVATPPATTDKSVAQPLPATTPAPTTQKTFVEPPMPTLPPPTTDKAVAEPLPAKVEEPWVKVIEAHQKKMNDAYDNLIEALQGMHGDTEAPITPTFSACDKLRKIAQTLPPAPTNTAYDAGYAEYCNGCSLLAKATSQLQAADFDATTSIVEGYKEYSEGYQKIRDISNAPAPATAPPATAQPSTAAPTPP